MNNNDFAIETSNLTKRFGSFTAVNSISFSVKRGEIFGFLGANGAGKTTAIRMLCGLLIPSSGTGHVAGFNISTQSSKLRNHIGYMSQKFSLYNDFL
jgi:ABC-2 type transport system ATP-binding protein